MASHGKGRVREIFIGAAPSPSPKTPSHRHFSALQSDRRVFAS